MRPLFLLVLILPTVVDAQKNIEVTGEVNFSTFSMSSMKHLQEQNALYSSVPLTTTSSFPSFIGYKIHAQMNVRPNLSAGIFGGFNTTGGRQTYQDYTGVAYNDIKCMGISTGLIGEYHLKDYKSFHFNAMLLLGAIFSRVDLIGVAELSQPVYYVRAENTFRSINWMINPGFSIRRPIGKIILRGQVSYEYNIANPLLHDGNKSKLQLPDGTTVDARWDGLRVGVGIAYQISKQTTEN